MWSPQPFHSRQSAPWAQLDASYAPLPLSVGFPPSNMSCVSCDRSTAIWTLLSLGNFDEPINVESSQSALWAQLDASPLPPSVSFMPVVLL